MIIKLPVTTAKQRQIATDVVPEIAIVVKTNRLEDERDGGHYGFHQTKLECRLKLDKGKCFVGILAHIQSHSHVAHLLAES